MENAKVTFITTSKLYSTYTNGKGQFNLEIPSEIIDNNNAIRLSFNEIVKIVRDEEKTNQPFEYYETDDLVLSKEEMNNEFVFHAKRDALYLGGIGAYSYDDENNPLVIVDNVEVPYKEFQKSRFGKKSTCNLENKEYYHFNPEVAQAISGEKAKYGLYLFFSKD